MLLISVLGLVAASCGSSGSDGTGPGTEPRGAQGNTIGLDDITPQPGGRVVFGTEADSDGFNPAVNRWAISGTMVALAVYDPLAAYDVNGDAQPYLAQSLEHDSAYSTWTIKLRPGVTFSDGTPLTADAVKVVLDDLRASTLAGPALTPIDSVAVTGELTTEVKMKSPWVAFPSALTGQTGVVPKPSTLQKGPNDEPASAALTPIGTGPFTQLEWRQGVSWTGKRNPHYWRKDAKGVALPYLDEIEFQPVIDAGQRRQAFVAGNLQMLHTDEQSSLKAFRDEAAQGQVKMVEDAGEGEESFLIFNVTADTVSDVNVRKALGYAINVAEYIDVTAEGIVEPATGPFRKGSKWYADTKGYPTYDVAKATALIDQYKAAHGGVTPKITLGLGGNDGTTIKRGQYIEQAWKAIGVDVTVKNDEQAAFITSAVTGQYQVNLWRQFGAPDPDYDYIWWTSANAGNAAGGGFSLNIARNRSTCVDTAIAAGREQAQLEARKKAYADLQQCLTDELPYLFLFHDIWAIVANNRVHNISNGPLPDGQASVPLAAGDFGGVLRLTNTWIEH